MGHEHRQAERHHVRFKLVYDDGDSFNAGGVLDVSEGGLFLETALPLPVGTVVRLAPLNDADLLFEVAARVKRSVPYDPTSMAPPGMGLEFIDVQADDKKRISDLIRTLEERARNYQGELDPYLGVMVPSELPHAAAPNVPHPAGDREPGAT